MLAEEAIRSRRTKTAVLVIAIEDYIAKQEEAVPEKPVDTRRKR